MIPAPLGAASGGTASGVLRYNPLSLRFLLDRRDRLTGRRIGIFAEKRYCVLRERYRRDSQWSGRNARMSIISIGLVEIVPQVNSPEAFLSSTRVMEPVKVLETAP